MQFEDVALFASIKKNLIALLNPFFRAHCAFYNYITINKSPRQKKLINCAKKEITTYMCYKWPTDLCLEIKVGDIEGHFFTSIISATYEIGIQKYRNILIAMLILIRFNFIKWLSKIKLIKFCNR